MDGIWGTVAQALSLRPLDTFARRHIGASEAETQEMLKVVGKAQTLDEFTSKVVPRAIALNQPLGVGEPLTETEFLTSLKSIVARNRPDIKSAIGMGYVRAPANGCNSGSRRGFDPAVRVCVAVLRVQLL